MVCRIFCPKPVSESMLTYCQLDPLEHFDEILVEIELWNYNWKWAVIIQENAFEHVVCKSAAIWPQPQCVNMYDLKLILNMPHGSFWIWSQPLRGDHDDVIKWKHFPRYWEFTGPQWIPPTKASDAELWRFLWSAPNKRLSKQWRIWWFETPSCPLWRQCNAVSLWLNPYPKWCLMPYS